MNTPASGYARDTQPVVRLHALSESTGERHDGQAAGHLGRTGPAPADLPGRAGLAADTHTGPRDLEGALVRLTQAHHRRGRGPCPGGKTVRPARAMASWPAADRVRQR